MAEFFSTIQQLDWTFVMDMALQCVGLFALIAAATPNTSDNAIADFLLRVVNSMGANVFNAKNSTE